MQEKRKGQAQDDTGSFGFISELNKLLDLRYSVLFWVGDMSEGSFKMKISKMIKAEMTEAKISRPEQNRPSEKETRWLNGVLFSRVTCLLGTVIVQVHK